MPAIRLIFLWHMHQPFYKDLVTGQYRLPWVRMHALKDYYGMVKLLDEFPGVKQNFNIVPSLVTQIEDYVAGTAKDAWRDVVSKPAADLTAQEKQFALAYLFQANHTHQVGRYPRYRELMNKAAAAKGNAAREFTTQDFADLQVLSQLAWFDEFFLDEPPVAELIRRGRDFNAGDQRTMLEYESRILAAVLPAYKRAAERGSVELSTTPFYHPILPLVCDTNNGRASSPGLPLPRRRFLQPNDALEQVRRAIELHERTFGAKPAGMWPSEGSVSNEVLSLARQTALQWIATDEGVLGRSTSNYFARDASGRLSPDSAHRLYQVYRAGEDSNPVFMVFRDHNLSDLIGFVYSGMNAADAAKHFVHSVRSSAAPVLASGRDAVVPVILDGENAWEHFPGSGREFLRRLYAAIDSDPHIEPVTVSDAIARAKDPPPLASLTPGSWINANFNVWIGAPEDNLSWDYLGEARDFYARQSASASPENRRLAYEELLIAEGSDWNWWYGPEHHTANDRDFDELYRSHLSNVYRLLGATPPDYLLQPISTETLGQGRTVPQTSFIRPNIESPSVGYFDWLGAATFSADRRSAAMHGKKFWLERAHAGVNEESLFLRVDFAPGLSGEFEVQARIEVSPAVIDRARQAWVATFRMNGDALTSASFSRAQEPTNGHGESSHPSLRAAFNRMLRAEVKLADLGAQPDDRLLLRFSLYRDRLPLDSLPAQGWMEIRVVQEESMLDTGDYAW